MSDIESSFARCLAAKFRHLEYFKINLCAKIGYIYKM